MNSRNVIKEKSLEFGLEVIQFCELLDEAKKYVVSKQLLRSGTSIGANIFEAQHAESRADFIHRIKLAMRKQMKQNIGYTYAKRVRTIQRIANSNRC